MRGFTTNRFAELYLCFRVKTSGSDWLVLQCFKSAAKFSQCVQRGLNIFYQFCQNPFSERLKFVLLHCSCTRHGLWLRVYFHWNIPSTTFVNIRTSSGWQIHFLQNLPGALYCRTILHNVRVLMLKKMFLKHFPACGVFLPRAVFSKGTSCAKLCRAMRS